MTAAVRKKDEELTINLKCIISVLMTDSGSRFIVSSSSFLHCCRHIAARFFRCNKQHLRQDLKADFMTVAWKRDEA